LRVAATVVMTAGIAAAIALPAMVGGDGSRHVVNAPRSAGGETVRVPGPAASAAPRRSRPARFSSASAPQRERHVVARPALATVGLVRRSTPHAAIAARPADAPRRRPAPTPAPTPAPKSTPVPTSPPVPSPQPAPQPAPQPVVPTGQQQVQTRELVSTPKPAPTPPPTPAAPKPSPPSAPTPQPGPPPVTPPSPPPARGHDRGSADDRAERHEEERSRDDSPAEHRDHDSGRDS
jgi:hypothetical protein